MAKGGKQESLDRFLTQTPNNNNKRSDPFSPDNALTVVTLDFTFT
jgi:hypothetical protein